MVRSVTRARKTVPAPAKREPAKAEKRPAPAEPAKKLEKPSGIKHAGIVHRMEPAPPAPVKPRRRFHCSVCGQRPSGCVCDFPSLVEESHQ